MAGTEQLPAEYKEGMHRNLQEVVVSPSVARQVFNNEFDMGLLLKTAGNLDITEEQKDILFAPVNADDVEIRPDGIIYLPWMEYAHRLTKAFGMSWTLVPNGMPKIHGNHIVWGFFLVIKGHLCGYAIGEQEYHPNNNRMTYSDACEATKSNALMRLCKGIGITLELWKPSFIKKWKETYAENYYELNNKTNKNEKRWRKKGDRSNGKADEGKSASQREQKTVSNEKKEAASSWNGISAALKIRVKQALMNRGKSEAEAVETANSLKSVDEANSLLQPVENKEAGSNAKATGNGAYGERVSAKDIIALKKRLKDKGLKDEEVGQIMSKVKTRYDYDQTVKEHGIAA